MSTEQDQAVPVDEQPAVDPIGPVAAAEPAEDTAGPYTGPEWTVERLRAELLRKRETESAACALVDRLASFIMDYLPDEITEERGPVDAVSIAIRVMRQFIDRPNGRLEPAVRLVVDQLEDLPAGDLQGMVDLATSARVTLRNALIVAPRPGGGPAPVYESDDITLVRYDRDRFRVELDLVCQTMAQMYAAATGRDGMPFQAGPVEDLQAVRARLLAAENALQVALRHSCDGEVTIPVEGTPAHRALVDIVDARLRQAEEISRRAMAAQRPGRAQ